MNFELLKNQEEFEAWKEGNIFPGDTAEQPYEFPCFARTVVQSWDHEEERAVYLCRSDVVKMLADLTPNAEVRGCANSELSNGEKQNG